MPFRASFAKKFSKIKYPKIFAAKELGITSPESIICYPGEIRRPYDDSPHILFIEPPDAHIIHTDIITDNNQYMVDLPLCSDLYDFDINIQFEIHSLIQQGDYPKTFPPEEYLRFENTSYNNIQFLISYADFIHQAVEIIFEPVEINEAINLLTSDSSGVISISNDLLKSIFPQQIKVFGKNYADKYWQKTIIYFSKTKNRKRYQIMGISENYIKPEGVHRNTREIDNIYKKSTSIWDLIYIFLLPPLKIEDTSSLSMPGHLYPYQIVGVDFLIKNDHALLADDMGTGKTVMTLMALRLLFRLGKVHSALILCPKSILYEWSRHLDIWAPEIIYHIVRGSQDIRGIIWKQFPHLFLTTYDTFASDMESGNIVRNEFDIIIIDEAHHIKNPNTRRYRSLEKLNSRKRWALTGTPIQNRIEDLFTIFDFIYPSYIPNNWRDERQYPYYQEEIKKKIAPYFLRRRKKDVLIDLPPKQRQEYWLELDDEQREEYYIIEGKIRDELSNYRYKSQLITGYFINKLMRLKQICNFASNKISSPKTDLLLEQVDEIVSGENKVIIFSQFVEEGVRKIVNLLKNHYDIATIKGSQSDSERRSQIELFKRNKAISVLVASVKAGGEGLNLTEASYVIHFDHWWNPAVMWQAEDRVHRSGQTKGVNIYSYWMKGTIDERIQQVLKKKNILINDFTEQLSEKKIDQILTIDDMLNILGIDSSLEYPSNEKNNKTMGISNLLEVKDYLLSLNPSNFEHLISEFMKYMGYPLVKVTGKTGDGGIDIICSKSPSFANDGTVAVQCKRYNGKVGINIAREFLGALQDNNLQNGYLITSGDFTKDCLSFCRKTGKIKTISGIELSKYIIQFGLYRSG